MPLCNTHIFPNAKTSKSWNSWFWKLSVRSVALLQNSSMLSGAEKLNSTGLQGHDSLFPLTLCPNYSIHFYFPGVDGLWLHRRRWHFLLSRYTVFLFSLFVLLPPRCVDIPTSPILSTGLTTFRLTSWWHVDGESKWVTLSPPLTTTAKMPKRKAFNSDGGAQQPAAV